MGWEIALGIFVLAIGYGVLRRKLNPYRDVSAAELPQELRSEIERVLPGFQLERARLTKNGDEARLRGDYRGNAIKIEADFARSGKLVEFEVDTVGKVRARSASASKQVPEAALSEIHRVLGDALPHFEQSLVTAGTVGEENYFEVEGEAGEWKWEIAVSASGLLLEIEKETRRR